VCLLQVLVWICVELFVQILLVVLVVFECGVGFLYDGFVV